MTITATSVDAGGRINALQGMRMKANVELVGRSPEIIALPHEVERVFL